MPRATGQSHAGGHNLMNAGAPDLPIEPRRRESSEEHQARMDEKRARNRRFEQLVRAAAAPSTKSVTLDRARAIDAYKAGEGVEPIAKRFHIGPATLQAWLKEAGVPLRDAAAAREARRATTSNKPGWRPAPLDVDALAAEYAAGATVDELAAKVGVSNATLRRHLRTHGVVLRRGAAAQRRPEPTPEPAPAPAPAPAEPPASRAAVSRPPAPRPVPRPPSATALRTPTKEDRDRLAAVTAYVAGDSVDAIAKRLGRGLSKIYAWLDAAGVPRRGRPVAPELDPAALAVEYRNGRGVVALAGKHATSPRRISAALREAGIDVTQRGPQATAAPDPAPALPAAAPSAPAPLSTPAPTTPDEQPVRPVEQPAARARRVDAGERAAIVGAYEGGETAVTIAARHGRTPKTIRDQLRAAGVQLRDDRAARSGGQRKVDDPATVAEVRRLYLDDGLTQAEVAARLGSSTKVVQRVMDRHGIPARPDAAGRSAPARPAPVREPRPLAPAPPSTAPADLERLRLQEALTTRPPSQIPDQAEAIASVRRAVEDVLDAARALADRWTDLQIARDLDAAGAFARIRVSAEQVLALTDQPTSERTAS